jgi:phage major head subunit gpT-like protein
MALTSTDLTKLLTSGLKTEFMKAFTESPKDHIIVSTPITSTKDLETYGWLGATPTMSEWKDERRPEGMSEYGFTVANRDWEASI